MSKPTTWPGGKPLPLRRVVETVKRAALSSLDRVGLAAAALDARARARYAADAGMRRRNARFRASDDHDGLPLPPPYLVYLVAGHFDLREYYESGRFHAAFVRRLLTEHGLALKEVGSLLDFGCGCGRVIRHWRELDGSSVHGCDWNRRLIRWCRRALPFADFRLNGLRPPLPYRDAQFGLVYAISVLTHLTEELQLAWMGELRRVLAPGGLLLITTKGLSRLGCLNADERARFQRGGLVCQAERYVGRNLCAAYHPESYVRHRLARDFRVLAFVPAAGDQTQDAYLLQKP